MREVSRTAPISSTGGSQPSVPWVIGVSAVAAVLLILGIGSHYANRFGLPSSSEGDIATKAPKTGKIVFSSNRDGNWDIWTMNPRRKRPCEPYTRCGKRSSPNLVTHR